MASRHVPPNHRPTPPAQIPLAHEEQARAPRMTRWRRLVLAGAQCAIALALVGAAPAAAAPSNDDFNSPGPTPLNVLQQQDNSTATVQTGEIMCSEHSDVNIDQTLWYRIPGTGGPITVSTVGSDFDTVLVVYKDVGDPTNGNNIVGCNDDFSGQTSQVTFNSTAGASYLLQIGGCAASANCGPDTGTIQFIALSNDTRAFAEDISAGT